MADIDRLEIGIEAYAGKANSELDKLVRRLEKIEGNLVRINASGLSSFAAGIEKLSKSMQAINGINTSAFTKLSKNLDKLASTDSARILQASSAINTMSRSIANAGAAMQSSVNISEMAKNIAKLGGKNVDRAVVILPKLAQELKNLMTTLAQAPNVSKNVIQMTNALANLSNALKGVRSANTQNASILSNLSGIFSGLSGSTRRASHSMLSFAQIAGKVYASYFLVIRAIKSLGSAIESAMDYVETYNYFSVTMDKVGRDFKKDFARFGYDSAEEYANSFTDRLNELTRKMTGFSVGKNGELNMTDSIGLALDPEKIQNFQASVAAVTNSVGLIGEASVNTSKALTMLSADLSSLKNVDLNTVMNNLQSGLIGQSRALYKYGIDITNNTLQTYAYANGIDKAVSEMTQAEKMQLRLLAILDQSKVAWGDQANTINSVANQYRILKQQTSNLARIIGNLFLPIVQKVLPVVNGMIIALQRLFTTLGFKIWGGNWLKDTMDGISGGSSNMDDLGDSADDSADAMENAAAAAKKLKTVVLGIDELNINNPNDDSGSGSGSGSGGKGFDLSDAIGDALADYEKVWDEAFANAANKAQEYADAICKAFSEAFKTGDFSNIGKFISDNITKALNSIDWEKVYEGARFFGKGLATFLNGLITPEEFAAVGRTIAGCLNTAVYTALSFGENLDWKNIGLSIATGINNFFSTFDFASLAKALNTWVDGLFTTITTAIANIDWWKAYKGINDFFKNIDISTIGIAIGALTIRKIGSVLLSGTVLKNIAGSIGGKISRAIATEMGSKLGLELAANAGIGTAFATLAGNMASIFSTGFAALLGNKAAESALAFSNPLTLAITGIISTLGGAVTAGTNFFAMWQDGFSWLNEAFMALGIAIAAVGAVLLGAPAVVAAAVAGIVASVATVAIVVKDNWDSIKKFSSDLWESIKSIFGKVSKWFEETVASPIATAFSSACEKISGFFNSLWTGIKNIWSTVSTWFSEKVIEPIAVFFEGLKKRVGQIFDGLWIIIRAIWIVASSWFNQYVTIPVTNLFNEVKNKVTTFFTDCWKNIKNVWNTVSEWFNKYVTTPVSTLFSNITSNISSFFSSCWDNVKGAWKKASNWFDEKVITPVQDAWEDATDAIGGFFDDLWKGIKSGVAGAMNSVISKIESALNSIVKGINTVLEKFNNFVSKAAEIADIKWKGVDKVPEVKLKRIAGYAEGGYPETGQLFMARENGLNEYVGRIGSRSAVANNDQITTAIESAVVRGMRADEQNELLREQNNLLRAILEKNTDITLDGKSLVSGIDKARKRMGWNFQPI